MRSGPVLVASDGEPVEPHRHPELYARHRACGAWDTTGDSPKQLAFLMLPHREASFGGAAGGGKSVAQLKAALQYVCVPGYSAFLLRNTYRQLAIDGGLIELSHLMLAGTKARWNKQDLRWTFPAGSSLTLGHIERDAARFKMQGSSLHYVGVDEATNFPSDVTYRYLYRSGRRAKGRHLPTCPSCGLSIADVPLRTRATMNPGGPGHDWCYLRFIKPWEDWRAAKAGPPKIPFISSLVTDNPFLDVTEYRRSLAELDPVTRAQYENGRWDVRAKGGILDRSWFPLVDTFPAGSRLCRAWDFAATAAEAGKDPDWTVGTLMALAPDGAWYIVHVVRFRGDPEEVDRRFVATAAEDRLRYGHVMQRAEQEGGSAGKIAVAHFRKQIPGHDFDAATASGSKAERARPLASAARAGNVRLVTGERPWDQTAWLDEADAFTGEGNGVHDDQVDSGAAALAWLAFGSSGRGGLRA